MSSTQNSYENKKNYFTRSRGTIKAAFSCVIYRNQLYLKQSLSEIILFIVEKCTSRICGAAFSPQTGVISKQ